MNARQIESLLTRSPVEAIGREDRGEGIGKRGEVRGEGIGKRGEGREVREER